MHYRLRNWGYAVAAILALLAAGCPSGERQVESAIRQELPRLVGPAASYEVDVSGVSRTGASRVSATGTRIRVPRAPVIDRAEVRLNDVTYSPARKEVQRIRSANATIRVLPGDLRSFLESQRALQDVTLDLAAPDVASVRARPQIAGLNLPPSAVVSLTGRLRPEGPTVRYEITEASAAGIPLPAQATALITRGINPIVDLRGMPLPLQVTAVRADPRGITLDAAGELTSPIAIP